MSKENAQPTEATPAAQGKKGVKPAEMKTSHREQRGKDIFVVPLSRVTVEEGFNKRTDDSYGDIAELARSIKAVGQITPAYGHCNPDGTWVLTAGHRRYAALLKLAKQTGEEQVMKIMKTDDKTTITRLTIQYVENVKHPTNDYDKALIIGGMLATKELTQQQVGEKLGIPQSMVSRLKDLLETPEAVQNAMRNKEISPGAVGKMLKTLKGDGDALAKEVETAKANAKAEGKTKATDRHSKAAGVRTPPTIMKDLVKRFDAKVKEGTPLTNAESFALEFCKKLLTKPSDQMLTAFLRSYDK